MPDAPDPLHFPAASHPRRHHAPPRPRPKFDQRLPILDRRADIEKAIASHQVCIICGETGSGKTTQLPQICLAMGRGTKGLIGHTQPRRLAARSVAARIAEELSVSLGGAVGCKVRFGDQTSGQTIIKLMTDGIMLAETRSDRDLRQYDTIIIDEAHERSLNIDFLMGYLKQLLPRRPDLKIIITSATIDTERLSNHFGGPAIAPVIEVSGRTYPVEVRYHAMGDEGDDFEEVEDNAVVDAVQELLSPRMTPGDILVFLPGEREIRNSATALRRQIKDDLDILPLYSRLSNSEQDRIFKVGARRRVILATNVAETSLTVPGIRYVVDSGLSRQSRYDPKTRVQKLPIASISKASAKQRAGRCGRVAAGVCIRLYGEDQYEAWPEFTKPEILRTNLASVILQMKSLRLGPVEEFPFVEPPDAAMIGDGYATLHELGAITTPDAAGELTPIGARLSGLPIDPRVARMIIAAEDEGCVREVLALASVLSIQDPRERPMSRQRDADTAHLSFYDEHSDFMVLLKIWDQYNHAADTLSHGALYSWCRERFLSFNRMREWGEMERQLRSMVLGGGEDGEGEESAPPQSVSMDPKTGKPRSLPDRIHRALMTGLLSNLCCRDEAGGETIYRGSRGNRANIFPGSVLFKKGGVGGPRWLMAAELVQTTRLFARTCAKIEPEWIEELAEHVMTKTVSDPHFDKETGQATAWERATLAGAVIVPRRKVPLATHDPLGARELFIRHVLVRGEYKQDAAFAKHNAAVAARAASIAAKLRDRNVLIDEAVLEHECDRRIDTSVCDLVTFEQWRSERERREPRLLYLQLQDRVRAEAIKEATPEKFPDAYLFAAAEDGETAAGRYEYCLEPGKEEDGVSLVVPLLSLPHVDPQGCEWLVPGILPQLIAALIKNADKGVRAALESAAKKGSKAFDIEQIGRDCAEAIDFGKGDLAAAISEAIGLFHECQIPAASWHLHALPDYMKLRLVVEDDRGRALAEGRDIADIKARLAGRVRKAQAGVARAKFRREGLTAWTFGELPTRVETETGGGVGGVGGEKEGDKPAIAFPALIDCGESVSLTLLEDARTAAAFTYNGVRRLFAIACADEVCARIEALGQWAEMQRNFTGLGGLGIAAELRDSMVCIIAERVFMSGQATIKYREAFEARQHEQWGRLGQAAIEVGTVLARVLEARFKVAGRFSGGTPRLWAGSVADIREQAAYLMPKGFLKAVAWERLREYPRYAEAMRERLFKLREDGSGVESKAMQEWQPHWKRFTGWVAAATAKEREIAAHTGAVGSGGAVEEVQTNATGGKGKPALPAARRAAPTVNADAGEWAMRPGVLPAAVESHRWLLEEFRVSLFVPELAVGTVSVKKVEESWTKVSKLGSD